MKTVYVTDDEPVPLRIIKRALERQKYKVELFYNGETTLSRVLEDAPDALVTDIEMPVMDGRELCQRVVDKLPDRDFPIFVVTSLPDRVHREWSSEIENLHFLEKPLSVSRLVDRLEDYFGPAGQ